MLQITRYRTVKSSRALGAEVMYRANGKGQKETRRVNNASEKYFMRPGHMEGSQSRRGSSESEGHSAMGTEAHERLRLPAQIAKS